MQQVKKSVLQAVQSLGNAFPGWLYEADETFVQDVLEALKAKGFDPAVTNITSVLMAAIMLGEEGIKTLGIPPSRENLAHTIDEYIEIDQLLKVTECYYATMDALLKG